MTNGIVETIVTVFLCEIISDVINEVNILFTINMIEYQTFEICKYSSSSHTFAQLEKNIKFIFDSITMRLR